MNKLYTLNGTKLYQYPTNSETNQMVGPWDVANSASVTATKNVATTVIEVDVASSSTRNPISNQSLFDELISCLKKQKISEMVKMTNNYKVFLTLTIYDANKKVLEDGIRIHPLEASDVYIVGSIDKDNDINCIKGKKFSIHLPIMFPKTSIGVVRTDSRAPKYVRIKGIEVMAVKDDENSTEVIKSLNQTILDRSLPQNSPSLSAVEENMVRLWSSYQDGVSFNVVSLTNSPLSLDLRINILLAGYTEVYDDSIITTILEKNEKETATPGSPDNPITPKPGDNDFFSQYERHESTYPGAGIVVADEDYSETIKVKNCFRYSDVVEDIPDIQVGEYVAYVESLVISSF